MCHVPDVAEVLQECSHGLHCGVWGCRGCIVQCCLHIAAWQMQWSDGNRRTVELQRGKIWKLSRHILASAVICVVFAISVSLFWLVGLCVDWRLCPSLLARDGQEHTCLARIQWTAEHVSYFAVEKSWNRKSFSGCKAELQELLHGLNTLWALRFSTPARKHINTSSQNARAAKAYESVRLHQCNFFLNQLGSDNIFSMLCLSCFAIPFQHARRPSWRLPTSECMWSMSQCNSAMKSNPFRWKMHRFNVVV